METCRVDTQLQARTDDFSIAEYNAYETYVCKTVTHICLPVSLVTNILGNRQDHLVSNIASVNNYVYFHSIAVAFPRYLQI